MGRYTSATLCSIFLYAKDDIVLTVPSVSALQILLNACEEELLAIDMYINKKKTMCIRFGRRYNEQCTELVTADGGHLSWVDRCRYLRRCVLHLRLFAEMLPRGC